MDGGVALAGPRITTTPDIVLGVTASLTNRAWHWRRAEDRLALALAQRLDVPEIVGRILAARDIGVDDAADFLQPTLRALLPDPGSLLDMECAADRLASAIATGETVAVFGDYDVDGACSAALLTLFLRGLGCPVLPYVPDRMTEGYGPNTPALSALVARGATLIVCVDCGTAAAAAFAAMATAADIIVLDHHKAEGPPPPVLATVNPNRLDDTSGLRHLCAAGVAFMAAIATLRALRRRGFFTARAEPDLKSLLDLVALATVCDVMPLTGLNRALVTQGLKIMAGGARPGVAALLAVAQSRGLPSAMTCGFALGPRINAGGRISESDLGLRLLLCEDALEARGLAERLDAVNRQRQTVEAGVLDPAIRAAEAQMAEGHAVLLVCGEAWHPGVVGIVAGRLREKFNRPACVGGTASGLVKGSGRSVPGIDLGAAILAARQAGLLETGGGHAMAAGFSFQAARQDAFHAFLRERLADVLHLPATVHLDVEATVSPRGASLELARALGRLAPFGAGNAEPMVVLPSVRVARADRLGNDGNTVRAMVEGDGGRVKTLLFRAGEGPLAQALMDRAGGLLHLAGHVRAEAWNGTESVGFFVRDAAIA
jgi:single-stranded-DNA-specific exonuclease